MKSKHSIPEQFFRGDDQPVCTNVGSLIEQLKRLPKDLPCNCGLSNAVRLVVYNINIDRHLSIEEADEEDFEDEWFRKG